MKLSGIKSKKIVVVVAKKQGLKIIKKSIHLFKKEETLFCWQGKILDIADSFFKKQKIELYLFSSKVKKEILKQKDNNFNWLLNLWGGEIFPQELLGKFRRSLNIHPSYLPFGKGRDPIVWGLINEEPLGFSFHEITPRIDSGRILFRKRVQIKFPTKGFEAYDSVLKLIPIEFAKFWKKVVSKNKIRSIIQQKRGIITKRKHLFENQVINLDSDKKAKKIILKILAYDFSERFNIFINYKNKRYKAFLKLQKAHE
jgi:methionyl-tRNA formyltransferase